MMARRSLVSRLSGLAPPLAKARLQRAMARFRPPAKWAEIEESVLHLIAPRNRVAIDVGANAGSYTVALALLTPCVIALEPHPEAARHLQARRLPNVEVLVRAASDHRGVATLSTPVSGARKAVAMASLEPPERTGKAVERLEIETCLLDDFADRDVGFVKIDVEGHEHRVLAGARALIERRRPCVLIEVEDRHRAGALEDVRAFFDARGYVGYFIYDRRTHDLGDLAPEMLNADELARDVPRTEMRYVNNFIFEPRESDAARRRAAIDAHLAQTARRR